jgi:rhamnulokinase/L-fuculokinase
METKNKYKNVLAIDIGASSGRAVIGTFDGHAIDFREIHRFANDPVIVNGTLYWDVLRLTHEIKQSLRLASAAGDIDSVAVDTWGVDFGALDKKGNLMGNPVHYRDARTNGMLAKALEKIGREEFYAITGVQFMEINTVFQLLSLKENDPDFLDRIDRILMMPDLFHYFLCGVKVAEISNASTAHILDARSKTWSGALMDRLGLPQKILPQLVKSGTAIGMLSDEICGELGIKPTRVIAVAGHDTQSAMAATPAKGDDFLFLSCGTWSLLGTEMDAPLLGPKALQLHLTNEIGFGDKISFLKNIVGLWLLQESRRHWAKEDR